IGIDPMIDVAEVNDEFIIRDIQNGFEATKPSFEDAFDAVLAELNVKIPDIDIPFKGGGVGYISYDAISDFEPVPRAIATEDKLSCYNLVFCHTLLSYNHRTREITILTFAVIDQYATSREIYDRANHNFQHLRHRLVKNSELTDPMMQVGLYESPSKKME